MAVRAPEIATASIQDTSQFSGKINKGKLCKPPNIHKEILCKQDRNILQICDFSNATVNMGKRTGKTDYGLPNIRQPEKSGCLNI
jgi:hypothetical protein